ncbi:hypothetical protein R6Q59_023842 [Mikania micrantha]
MVLCSFEAAHAGRNILHCSTERVLNKAPLKSIKKLTIRNSQQSPDGDIIDCVHICHQPAFNNPSLKNHTIKMRPNYYPKLMTDEKISMSSVTNTTKVGRKGIVQLWHSNGKCPKGTIPIRRTKKNVDQTVISNLHKKRSRFFNDSELYTDSPHEYAVAALNGQFFGSKATINVWNPKVEGQTEFSLTQLWLVAGGDTIEAGWQVAPVIYGDANTRFFVFWTNDGYRNTVCYNLDCQPGFVQTGNSIAIGGTISPTSQADGSQYQITLFVWRDPTGGDWWLSVDGAVVGYWPAALYTYMNQGATMAEWGGEIINSHEDGYHTSTQMGSGHFAEEGYGKASFVKDIQIIDESNNLRTPGYFQTQVNNKNCYDIVMGSNENSGASFSYGGPGRNQACM